MSSEVPTGPVKAWIEPDRWTLLRAEPLRAALLWIVAAASGTAGFLVHPAFLVLTALSLVRQATLEASLRELFRDGMLHPAIALERGRIATLVRLDREGRHQDAVVISRMPRRWTRGLPPWGGERAAMVIAGDPPKLRPLSPDYAVRDLSRARRATERIPAAQWLALSSALEQLPERGEGVYPVDLGATPWYGTVRDLEVEGSLPEHVQTHRPHAWCAGLPLVEQPTMVERERVAIAKRRGRAYRRAGLLLIGSSLFGIAGVLLRTMPIGAAMLWLTVALLPFALGFTVLLVARARAYTRDLRSGELLRFAGAVSAFDSLGSDRDLAQLARKRVFTPEPGVEQDLSVLSCSRELLHANGQWAPPGVALHVSQIAAPPDEPAKLALPGELRSAAPGTLDIGRRRFTHAELAELEHHAVRLRKPGLPLWLLTPLGLFAIFVLVTEGMAFATRFASAPLAAAMWLFAIQIFVRRVRFAGRLRSDLELGWVITVDHGSRDEDPELPARGVESLLHTRLDWTVNKRPATWRRF